MNRRKQPFKPLPRHIRFWTLKVCFTDEERIKYSKDSLEKAIRESFSRGLLLKIEKLELKET